MSQQLQLQGGSTALSQKWTSCIGYTCTFLGNSRPLQRSDLASLINGRRFSFVFKIYDSTPRGPPATKGSAVSEQTVPVTAYCDKCEVDYYRPDLFLESCHDCSIPSSSGFIYNKNCLKVRLLGEQASAEKYPCALRHPPALSLLFG